MSTTKYASTSNRFRSISNFQGARDVADLACRVQMAMDNLNSKLNSIVAPSIGKCCETEEPWVYKDVKFTGGSVAWYLARHDSATQKLGNVQWFHITPDGYTMVVGYTVSANYWVAKYKLSATHPFQSGTGDGNTNYLQPVKYKDHGATWVGDWGYVTPNQRYILDIDTTKISVMDMETLEVVSSASGTAGTSIQPGNGFAYDTENSLLYVSANADKVGYVFSLNQESGVISKLPNFTWSSPTGRIRSLSLDVDNERLVAGDNSGNILVFGLSNRRVPNLLDYADLSVDSASLGGGTVRAVLDCEDTDVVYALCLNAALTKRHLAIYSMDGDGILTFTNQAEVLSSSVTTYAGEGFWSSQGIFRFAHAHESSDAALLSIDVSSPSAITVAQNYEMPNDGAASNEYQFPRFDKFVQYHNGNSAFYTFDGLKEVDDDTKLRTIELDQLVFRNRGCLSYLIAPNKRMVPNLNAQFLGGVAISDIQQRADVAVDTWLWET